MMISFIIDSCSADTCYVGEVLRCCRGAVWFGHRAAANLARQQSHHYGWVLWWKKGYLPGQSGVGC